MDNHEYCIDGFDVPYGILVTLKNIKAKFETLKIVDHQDNDTGASDEYRKHEKEFDLRHDTRTWLLEQAQGFRVFCVAQTLFLITKHDLARHCEMYIVGPAYVDEASLRIGYLVDRSNCTEEEDEEYLEVARKLKPEDKKFTAHPGRYSFTYTEKDVRVFEVCPETMMDKEEEEASVDDSINVPVWQQEQIPQDLSIVVGKAENQKTIETNRAVLCCFLDGFQNLLESSQDQNFLLLPDWDPVAFENVLDHHFTNRMKRSWCTYSGPYPYYLLDDDMYSKITVVLEALKSTPYPTTGTGPKALVDPQWLDATFVCGPEKEKVNVNRACLASVNSVLKKILYGTGRITVDPTKPIVWPDYKAGAVRKIFEALLTRNFHKEEVVVPLEWSESGERLVDYICESADSLNVYFETQFERTTSLEGEFEVDGYHAQVE